MITVDANKLTNFATQLLGAGGLDEVEAALVARSLVGANLRGHDSHGVMRIPFYLARLKAGDVVADAPFSVLSETDTLITADGHWGFGQTQARRLTDRLIDKARDHGVGVGTLIHSSHIGRLGEYCEQAAEEGMIAIYMVNTHGTARRVAPPGGKAPRLGTNPLAIGIPNGDSPLVLDFGTSATAEGKVRVKRIAGEKCPDGWLLDSEGRPTNDPTELYADPPGTILPMGGAQGYKGFGLALMIEIFAGALSGGVCIREKPINPNGNCVYAQVLEPSFLGGSDHFAAEVSQLISFVRGCPPIERDGQIVLPGDPERQTLSTRLADGVPFDERNWAELVKLADDSGVELPV